MEKTYTNIKRNEGYFDNTVLFPVRISPDLKQRIKKYSEENDISMSQLVRKSIEKILRNKYE